ncbi:SPX domain, EXS [Artemisia annua]|uniref:SPX domain, EXS n=1 Tax=Artemisia annua TaxID=35608 RepID=A0A2U1PQG4_ARTAN|nr:SPX domain, EXS [Artemisia annua]
MGDKKGEKEMVRPCGRDGEYLVLGELVGREGEGQRGFDRGFYKNGVCDFWFWAVGGIWARGWGKGLMGLDNGFLDAYLQMVEESYLSQSDEVTKLIDRVEVAFVKHFCNGNRHQAMNTLRPKAKRARRRITFFVGCFFGCSLALVVAIISVIHARDLLNSEGFKEVLLLGSGLSVLTLAGILSNLEMQMDQRTQSYKALTELVPLGLVIVRISSSSPVF